VVLVRARRRRSHYESEYEAALAVALGCKITAAGALEKAIEE
jgi:hypothetical protein